MSVERRDASKGSFWVLSEVKGFHRNLSEAFAKEDPMREQRGEAEFGFGGMNLREILQKGPIIYGGEVHFLPGI